MLICGHPNEDELVTRCLRKTLHPTSSLSVTEEYERLLVHFLGQLYEAVDPYELIRDYSYPVDEMRAFASRLDKSGTVIAFPHLINDMKRLLNIVQRCQGAVFSALLY